MPTTPFPGIGASTRIEMTSSAILRSSARFAMVATRVPGAGRTSNLVTTGPGQIWVTVPLTL